MDDMKITQAKKRYTDKWTIRKLPKSKRDIRINGRYEYTSKKEIYGFINGRFEYEHRRYKDCYEEYIISLHYK